MKKSLLGISAIALTVGFIGSSNAEGIMDQVKNALPSEDQANIEKPDANSAIDKFKEKLGLNKAEGEGEEKADDVAEGEGEEKADDATEGEGEEKADDAAEGEGEEKADDAAEGEGEEKAEKAEGDGDGDADDMPKKKSIWDYFKR